MADSAQQPQLSFAEYVRLEASSLQKHEYLDGEVFAMAGGTPEHAALAANVIGELRTQLRSSGCHVFTSDLRVRVPATGLATYPDVTVVCGPLERDPEDENTVTNPTLIVEVLSAGTEGYDREEKLAHYRRIATLRAYILVSQQERRVELYTRNEDSTWTLHEARTSGAIRLSNPQCELDLAEVYGELPT